MSDLQAQPDVACLLRQFEARLRGCGRGDTLSDLRRRLTQTGMTGDQVWALELTIRRRIRDERAARPVRSLNRDLQTRPHHP
ncbi:hypothetical protein AB0D12_31875 [Streptomyces sp. NPDC048479]|uniref:hypothetical protein n=1 Tax=Streptomyces sp. NPDC048479 TaxID=3154725 RepID=UPI00343E8E78